MIFEFWATKCNAEQEKAEEGGDYWQKRRRETWGKKVKGKSEYIKEMKGWNERWRLRERKYKNKNKKVGSPI